VNLMHINESNTEEYILPSDVNEAITLIMFRDYCIAQMNYCIERFDGKGMRHWVLEYQRSVNDLKHLQFKKIESERIDFDEKNYTFGN